MTLPPLPCPFCGSTNIRTDDARDFLACMDCHAEGPGNIGMGSNYAVEAWNRRAAIAAHVPEAECGNIAAVPAQPPAPTAQQCTCPSGDGSLRWPCPQHPANIVQPVQQPGAEPDGRLHADGYFTWKRRDGYVLDAKLPCDFYLAAPAQRQPLSDEEIEAIWKAHVLPGFGERQRFYSPVVYARAIESAHGIAAQKGEKL